jgi:WD40 repeat protein/serine/threonine protein kinase
LINARERSGLGQAGAQRGSADFSLFEHAEASPDEPVQPDVGGRGDDEVAESLPSELVGRLSGRASSFDRYTLEGEIARGGMGVIRRIWDEDLRRPLAMKVILGRARACSSAGTPSSEARRVARFVEEAQVTGQLDHPGVVPVHELGLDPEGRLYFTMKLVKGRSLKEVFDLVAERKERWTRTKALGVLLKVCEAMSYAHDKGVIHRDLKPGNIMVGDFGEVYVIDWGLARILRKSDPKDIRIREDSAGSVSSVRSDGDGQRGEDVDSPLYTMDGDVIGTPAYMSPEQAAGRLNEIGPHSDVYAWGAMLYHLLAGQMPYARDDRRLDNHAIWRLLQQGPPASIAQLAPRAPAPLVAICDKAMARDWKLRYRDMSELGADLSAYLEHRVVGAYQSGAWAETKKWIERNKPLAASVAAAIAILVAGVIGTTTFAVYADRQRDEALRAAYAADIAAAEAAIEVGEGGSARARLSEAAQTLRGWEWKYLMHRADESLETISSAGQGAATVVISPDESQILIERGTSSGSTLTMREAATGAIAWFQKADVFTDRVCFARDGSRFAMGNDTNKDNVSIWSAASGELIHRWTVPRVDSLCFDADGRRLWTGDDDGRVRLWDIESQSALRELAVPTARVMTMDLSPDGKRLAVNGKVDTVVWDARSGELEKRLPLPPDASDPNFMTVRFSPDGSLLAVANELTIQLFELPSWSQRPVRRGHTQRIFSLAFSPDGATLASGSLDQTVRLWSVATGEQVALRLGHLNVIRSMGFFDGGMRLASADWDGAVKVFDATSWSDAPTIDLGPPSWSFVRSISFGRGSAHVLCSSWERALWDLDTRSAVLNVPPGGIGEPFATALSPDGRFFASGYQGGDVSVSETHSGTELWRKSVHSGNITSIDYTPDGLRLASASVDHTIRIWEAATGRVLLTIEGHDDGVSWIQFSPDGTRLASASDDGTAKIWDARDGSPIATFRGHRNAVQCVSFDADGRRVASASVDQTVQIWEAATGRPLRVLSGVHAPFYCVAFSPDGTRLATGSLDGLVRIWDANTGQALLVLRGHTRTVMTVAWSPDGRRLVSGSYAGVVRIWDSPPLGGQ